MLNPNTRMRTKVLAAGSLFARLRGDNRGLSTVEYVIILVLIAAVSVATWGAFGNKMKGWLGVGESKIDHELTGAIAREMPGSAGGPDPGGNANPGTGNATPPSPGTEPEEPRVKVKRKTGTSPSP